ncbi:hypothetical protein DFJ74DRAFT_684081 [Hyaloraphidium curvatum]|nr:hypothetical protein DFJ74DRAFT_684081 [Hyaloraphidium curvatum]
MCTGQPDSEGCKVSLMGVRESEVPDWAGGPKKAANGAANGHHPAKPIDFSPGATNEEPIVYERVVIGSPKAEAFLFSLWQRHVPNLYKRFPNLKADIDRYVKHASGAVNSIPMFVLSKLFPLWLQRIVNPYLLKTFRYYAGMTTEEAFEHITDKTELRNLLSSLWMDIGAPPARGTFTLTAAVVWGFPQRGGAYPAGGSEELAKSLVRTIERYGGRVLVKADVAEILVEPEGSGFRAAGVKLRDGTEIRAPNVVSSVGYANTWSKLVPERVTSKLGIPRTLSDRVGPSAGFVMANIGLRASREEMGLQCYNTWYLPVDGSGDTFPAIRANFADPLGCDVPCMITFPSIKDRAWAEKDRETCQILVMVDGEPHFSKWLGKDSGKPGEDNEAYEALKKRWGDVLTERLLSLFPKMKREHVALVDISTPATIQYYLREPEGGAVGLDQTPRRFTDPAVQELLDMSTPVRGLWQTGQDTLICGQPLVQLAGAITAFRMMGFWKAAGLLLQTSLWELEGDGEEKK